ncbi:Phage-related minor tail protein [compost metagenome]
MADTSAALNFILKLTDQVTAPLAKVKMGFNDLAEKGQANIMQMGAGLAGMVGAGMAITESLQPALEMNRALGEVRSLGVAEDALDALERKALQFSVAYGENAQAFVASAYQIEGAIKGLSGSQLATFTNASNLLAKATKSDAETMTTYVGSMYNLFKGQADAMGKGEWVEQLAGQTALATQLFRTSGEQIGEAFKAAGGLASTAGVSMAEQMAVLGTLGNTMEGGDAGGLYKAFFENIAGASEKLGMSFTDSNGRLLPMLDIIEKLKGRFGDLSVEANATALSDAFGGEAAMLVTRLMGDTERLRGGIEQLGQVRGLEQAEKMAQAMVDPWQQFGAAVEALRVVFGQVLIPLLTPLMARLTGIAGTLTRWTQLFPNIARVIGIVVLTVFGLTAGVSALTFAVGLAKMAWLALSSSFLFNPMVWIVVGIVALVAAVIGLIYYWDELVASFGNTAWFQALVTMLTPVVLLFRLFGALLNVLWVGLQMGVGYGAQFVAWLLQLEAVTTTAKAIWDGFIWALTNLSPFALLGDALKGLIGLLNKIPGVEIDTSFGAMPEIPAAPSVQTPLPSTPAVDRALQQGMPDGVATTQPLMMPQPSVQPPEPIAVPAPLIQAAPALVLAPPPTAQAETAQQRINTPLASLTPERPAAVPQGGLLSSIQNTQNQNTGTRVEKVEIHTGKPMSPLELENMMSMAVGG